jgi:hypothetical protein
MKPGLEDRINKHLKVRHFEAGAKSGWRFVSLGLKHAADRLYDLYYEATEREIRRAREEFKSGRESESSRFEGQELEDAWDSMLIRPYYLLVGYAVENLLKGILMVQHPEYFQPSGKMTRIRTHDLLGICGHCRIPLTQEESNLLKRLKRCIEWQGKYPVPLNGNDMPPIRLPDGTWEESAGGPYGGRKRQQEIDCLYMKLLSELEALSKAQTADGGSQNS